MHACTISGIFFLIIEWQKHKPCNKDKLLDIFLKKPKPSYLWEAHFLRAACSQPPWAGTPLKLEELSPPGKPFPQSLQADRSPEGPRRRWGSRGGGGWRCKRRSDAAGVLYRWCLDTGQSNNHTLLHSWWPAFHGTPTQHFPQSLTGHRCPCP